MNDSSPVKEEVLPESENEKLGNAIAKKLEFYDGVNWIEINAGGISGKEHEINVTPNQNSPGKVVSLADNPILPGDTIINSTGFLKLPVGTNLQRPVTAQIGMMRFCITACTNVSVTPAFPVELAPIGTGPTNTVIDYNKFNYNVWELNINMGITDHIASFHPSGHTSPDSVHLASLTVSELTFYSYGVTLRWPTPIDFANNDHFLLTFS